MGAEGPLRKKASRHARPAAAELLLIFLQLTVLFVVFWKAGTYVARPRVASSTSTTAPPLTEHPIPHLMAAAEDEFRAKLARQSTSLGEAVAEYKRRYGRDPPKGFDKWYWYAVKHKFVLKDEFDAIDEDLRPFWALSGQELRRRVDQVRFVCWILVMLDVLTRRDGCVGWTLAFDLARAGERRESDGTQPRQQYRPRQRSERACAWLSEDD